MTYRLLIESTAADLQTSSRIIWVRSTDTN